MEAIQTVIRVQNIRYDKAEEALYIIDQTKLPGEEREIRLRTVEEMEEAIRACGSGRTGYRYLCAYCLYVLAAPSTPRRAVRFWSSSGHWPSASAMPGPRR